MGKNHAPNGLSTTLAEFSATIQNTRNRLVAIPRAVQKEVGLEIRRNNHIVRVSWRRSGGGHWNHHYVKLTGDNEFSIPSDVVGLKQGDQIDVKVHRVIPDVGLPIAAQNRTAATLLLEIADAAPEEGWRTDGSTRLDEYMNEDVRR
jgi:hypothetical protein